MSDKYWGALWMALAASIWGGVYVVSKIMLTTIEPMALAWLRYVVALAFLGILRIFRGKNWRIHWHDVPLIVVIGIVGYVISLWAQFRGTQLSTAQTGAVVTSATPAFMAIFGRFVLGERLSVQRVLSMGLATLGVLFVVGIGGFSPTHHWAGLILLLAAVSWAFMSVLVKRVPHEYSLWLVTTYGILVATLLLTPWALPEMPPLAAIVSRPAVWLGILYIGVISTGVAFYLWNRGLQLVDASSGGLYFFFQPLVGTALGWLVLGEQLGWAFGVGAVFILVGVLLTIRG